MQQLRLLEIVAIFENENEPFSSVQGPFSQTKLSLYKYLTRLVTSMTFSDITLEG